MSDTEILSVNGRDFTMEYAKFGHGEKAFVILPGLSLKSVMLSAEAVAAAYSGFTEEYTVYLFDRIKDIPDQYTVGDMADHTAEAMRRVGISSADFFGASQGGMIALAMAVKYPELVNKAVIGSSEARPDDSVIRLFSEWKRLADERRTAELNRNVFGNLYSEEYLKKYADIFAVMENDGTDEECRNFSVLVEAAISFNIYEELPAVRCPILAIGDRRDKIFGKTGTEEIAERTGGEMYIYDGYGHAVYDEAPDYRDRIMEFFRR